MLCATTRLRESAQRRAQLRARDNGTPRHTKRPSAAVQSWPAQSDAAAPPIVIAVSAADCVSLVTHEWQQVLFAAEPCAQRFDAGHQFGLSCTARGTLDTIKGAE